MREELHKTHLAVILEFFDNSAQRGKIAELFDDANVDDEEFKRECQLWLLTASIFITQFI